MPTAKTGARRSRLMRGAHALWVVTTAMVLSSSAANAAGWYTGEIATIQLNQSGGIVVWLNASSNNECGSNRVDYVSSNDSPGKSILAALLSWQAQGKAASFYIESCVSTVAKFTDVKNAN